MNEQKQRIDQHLDRLENNDVSKYKPKFLGMGAEQMVFGLEGKENSVVKVNVGMLYRFLHQFNPETNEVEINQEQQRKIDDFIQLDRERAKTMRKYFGRHYLMERAMTMNVPVTKALLGEAYTDQDRFVQTFPSGEIELPSIVRIQEKAPKAMQESSASFNFSYLETEQISVGDYEKLNAMLIDQTEPFDLSFYKQNTSQELTLLLQNLESDEQLRETIKAFLEQVIEYVEKTGEVLDIAGEDNVQFYKEGDTWDYVLLDAKYPKPDLVRQAQEFLQNLVDGKEVKEWHLWVIGNYVNFLRTMNAFAELVGLEKRLHISIAIAPISQKLLSQIKTFRESKQ